jgi:hypothetical protein
LLVRTKKVTKGSLTIIQPTLQSLVRMLNLLELTAEIRLRLLDLTKPITQHVQLHLQTNRRRGRSWRASMELYSMRQKCLTLSIGDAELGSHR